MLLMVTVWEARDSPTALTVNDPLLWLQLPAEEAQLVLAVIAKEAGGVTVSEASAGVKEESMANGVERVMVMFEFSYSAIWLLLLREKVVIAAGV